jgi:hypothetical protein
LTRIEFYPFSYSSLETIVIPRNVEFIDGSAFISVRFSSISIENGNEYCVVVNDILIDIVHHTLIRNFSRLSHVEVPSSIEFLGSRGLSACKSL